MERRSGLGRGLGALIPAAEPSGGSSALRELAIDSVQPNRFQPRDHFDDETLASLAASISELGVLQPVLVRPVGDHFELIAGERRWRAARSVGLSVIPALVREVEDTTSLEQALVENLHREDLSALEEAAAFQQLVDDFALSYDEIGRRVGKSRSAVANSVRLLQLPPAIQRMVNEKKLSAGHARALLGLEDPELRQPLADRIVAEDLSVRATESAVRHANTHPRGTDDHHEAGEAPSAGILEIEEVLSERLATRVRVSMAAGERGRIVVSFAGNDDLDRLYRLLTGDAAPLPDS